MKTLFPVLLALFLSVQVQAENSDKVLDINFPDATTGAVFQLSHAKPQLTLLSFWQTDCKPCLKDLVPLSAFSKQHDDVRVIAISLSDKKSTRQIWQQQNMPFPTLVNDGFSGELLKRFGNSLVAVPYTVMLDMERHLCWSAMGQITAEQLQQGIVACRMPT